MPAIPFTVDGKRYTTQDVARSAPVIDSRRWQDSIPPSLTLASSRARNILRPLRFHVQELVNVGKDAQTVSIPRKRA